jgi:hypothetical protein
MMLGKPIGRRNRAAVRPATVALYGAAVAVALGAAAFGSAVLAPEVFSRSADEPTLVVSFGARPAGMPDRIAGIIEPALPATPVATRQAPAAPLVAPAATPPLAAAIPIPPKPQPRPCLECAPRKLAADPAAPTAAPVAAADEAPLMLASAEAEGPVPPMPIGAGEGARPGLLMRGGQAVVQGGQAVVEGSAALVGSAWSMSGAAVGGIVQSVRDVTF